MVFVELTNKTYLHEEKILHMVKTYEKSENVEIVNYDLSAGAGEGANFCGEIIKTSIEAKVNGQDKSYLWMSKLPPQDKTRLETIRKYKMEKKEIFFYSNLIPAFEEIVKKHNADIKFNFAPHIYSEFHEDQGKGSILAMEHMGSHGFEEPRNKTRGLSLDTMKVLMKEIAKLHAVSYVYLKTYPGGGLEAAKKEIGFVLENDLKVALDDLKPNEESNIECILLLLKGAQEDGQDFVGAFKRAHEKRNFFDARSELAFADPNGFKCLTHGDCWFNNMLVKYDENNKAADVCLVDLAIVHHKNPCGDLTEFLLTCTTPQLRRTHLDEILETYHNHLTSYLHQLGQDPSIYPYTQFRQDFKKYYLHGFLLAVLFFPLMHGGDIDQSSMNTEEHDNTEEGSFNKLMKEIRSKVENLYKSAPHTKTKMAGMAMEAMEMGIM